MVVRRLALAAGAVLAAGAGTWLYLRASLPPLSGALDVPGLDAAAEIVRDADGVPHIRAASDHDAWFALGFAHAQDRLWQMEMQRRVGTGRLSEVLGEATVETDQFLRTLGIHRAAEAALAHASPDARAVLDAYAAGVNAWLGAGHPLPPELTLLGVRPAPWTPLDSMAWAKMMAWDLGGNWDDDLLRVRLAQAVGPERAAELLPDYPPDGATIVAAAHVPAAMSDALLDLDMRLQVDHRLGGRDVGSNNWVVAGRHTASGLPLLANDPHLGARIPSTWYLAEIEGHRVHVAGATLPGLPGVLAGRNEAIAWGATNLGPDVQDLYLERLNPDDPNQYAIGDRWVDMRIVEETIVVKGRDAPIRWAARATRHGPLVSDASDTPGAPLALRWTALDDDDTTLDAFLDLQLAADWEQFLAALSQLVVPGQNFVYADRAGNIGYAATGRIPIRPAGDTGGVPLPGWEDGHAWSGWIPWDALPRVLDPAAGYIVTANNRVVDDDYPFSIARSWTPPYRAGRIIEALDARIAAGGRLDVTAMAAIQGDQTSHQARELAPRLASIAPADARQARAVDLVRAWDGRLGAESAAAAIYSAWFIALGEAVVADDLSGALYERYTERTHPQFLVDVIARRDAAWCDDVLSAPREDCDAIARRALDTALDSLEAQMGPDPGAWHWGTVHRTQYAHQPFSEVPYLRPFFHRSIANGGDGYTVNVAPVRLAARYEQHRVPSYRQIVDLSPADDSRFIVTTGQSGHPLSPHYDDLIARHQAVEDLPMRFGQAIPGGKRLVLRPQGNTGVKHPR